VLSTFRAGRNKLRSERSTLRISRTEDNAETTPDICP
jgi:hypothetical protein